MSRWVYGFRASSRRELTGLERQSLRIKGTQKRLLAWVSALAPISCAVLVLAGIALAAGSPWYVWLIPVACVAGFFKSLSFANETDRVGLLFRRAARRGVVERFENSEPTEAVRRAYRELQNPPVDKDEEPYIPKDRFWEDEERFREKLQKQLGRPAQWFEVLADDATLLTIEGQFVRRTADLDVVEIKDTDPSQAAKPQAAS